MTTYYITTEDKDAFINACATIQKMPVFIGMIDRDYVYKIELLDGISIEQIAEYSVISSASKTCHLTNPFEPPTQHGGAIMGFQIKPYGKENEKGNDSRVIGDNTERGEL